VGPKRLRVIENGVDIDKFADAASPTLQPTLVYFGRWSVNKGLLDTLDTLAALCAQQPDIPWRLIIAGRAYDLDAEMLAAQAQMRGLTGRVTLVPEPGNAELRDYLGQASYYICQSRHEGFGIAPIEGMSAGLIPLLSAIPPFERLVGSARTGLLLDAPDAVSRAHQIGRLHQRHREHPGDFANDSARALRGAQAYAWSGVARQYGAQYHDVLDH
jgi:alpha-1,3-mannosyltransferase